MWKYLNEFCKSIIHIRKSLHWQAAPTAPDFHPNRYCSTDINWASLYKHQGHWHCLPQEAVGNPLVSKLQLHRSSVSTFPTQQLWAVLYRLWLTYPEPRSRVKRWGGEEIKYFSENCHFLYISKCPKQTPKPLVSLLSIWSSFTFLAEVSQNYRTLSFRWTR